MAEFDANKYFSLRSANTPDPSSTELLREKMNRVHQASQEKQLQALKNYSEALERSHIPDRSGEEVASDALAQFGIGSGNAVRGIGETAKVANAVPMLPGAAGLVSLGVEEARNRINSWLGTDKVIDEGSQALIDAGKQAAEYWHEDLSAPRQKALSLKQQRIAAAEKLHGQLGGFTQGLYESLADPENLIEQMPNLALTAAIARKGGAELAVVGGAALQGGDVAGQTREALDKLSDAQFKANSPEYASLIEAGKTPAEARRLVIDQKVEEAYLAGATASVALNKFVPGANSMERIMAGEAVKGTGAKAIAAAVAKGSMGEALSEGGEEGSGALISNERVSTINPEQSLTQGVGAAAGLGMGMGLQMGGGVNVMSGAATYAGAKAQASLDQAAEKAAERAAVKAAIEAGDATPFLDSSAPTYDPVKALQVLHGANQKEDATPEAQEANLKQATDIVTGLEAERETLQADLAALTPEGMQAKLDGYRAALAQVDPADTGKQQDYQTLIEMAEADLADMAAPEQQAQIAQERATLTQQLATADERISTARTRLDEMNAAFAPKVEEDIDVEAEVAAADSADTAVAAPAAARIINLAMASPTSLTPQRASQLASNTGNGLTAQQRTYLRQFAEARLAENLLLKQDEVSQRIYYGSKDGRDVGIAQYRERMARAVASKNVVEAALQLKGLTKFARDHAAKATAARQAMAKHGLSGQIIKVGNQWQVTTGMAQGPLRKAGGLDMKSPRLVKDIETESTALTAAVAELQATYELTFQAAPSTSAPAVQTQQTAVNSQLTQAAPAAPTQSSSTTVEGQNQSNVDSTVDKSKGTQSTVAPGAPVATQSTRDQLQKSWIEKALKASAQVLGKQLQTMSKAQLDGLADALEAYAKDPELDAKALTQVARVEDVVFTALERFDEVAAPAEATIQQGESQEAPTMDEDEWASLFESEDSREDLYAEEALEDASAETQEDVPVESGELSVYGEKSTDGKPYQERNLVADHTRQEAQREGDATPRPLVAVKNFLSMWIGRQLRMSRYVQVGKNGPTDAQVTVLQTFQELASEWRKPFLDTLKRKKAKATDKYPKSWFYYRNPIQFLIQEAEDGALTLDENVTTAMSYAAFSWIAENLSRGLFNGPQEINRILVRDEDTLVSPLEQALLGDVGTRQNVVITTLGQRIVQALGLKATKDAPVNEMARLETSLGAAAMKMLLDRGILKRTTITAAEMRVLTGSQEGGEAKHHFLAFNLDEAGQPTAEATRVFEASKGSQGILDNLFSVESGERAPTLAPVPFSQATTKSGQQVPAELAKAVDADNAMPNFVRKDKWKLLEQLSEDVALKIFGFVTPDPQTMSKLARRGLQAKNDGIRREYERFRDYVRLVLLKQEQGLDTPIYFEHDVWRQQRVGILTNTINPQASKLQRWLVYRQAWETVVDTTNTDHMNNFKLRVMEGFGEKTDRQSNVTSLARFGTITGTPEVTAAVDVLVQQLNGVQLTEAMQETLLAGVEAGGEAGHTLDALMALATWKQAVAAGETTFTTHLMGEVDGVANGPMLSHLLLGAAATVEQLYALLNRGGFYRAVDAVKNYNLWRAQPGSMDLYEKTATRMTGKTWFLGKQDPQVAAVTNAIYFFTGKLVKDYNKGAEKAGRNIVKSSLTPMVFGSSKKKAVEGMADTVIVQLVDKLAAAAVASKTEPGALKEAIQQANVLLGAHPLSENLTARQALDLELTPGQMLAIKSAFDASLGKGMKQVIDEDFAMFMASRDQINKTAQLAFSLYNAAYTSMRELYVADLVKQGAVAADGAGNPVHDLTAEQEAKLQKRLKALRPVMQSMMSLKSNATLDAGLVLAKTERKLNDDPLFAIEAEFGSPFEDGAERLNAHGMGMTFAEPGASPAPTSIHSFDSGVSHTVADAANTLNVHDARGSGLKGFEATARGFNKALWDGLVLFSPAQETYNALARTVNATAQLMRNKDVPVQVAQAIQKALDEFAAKEMKKGKKAGATTVAGVLEEIRHLAFEADKMKLSAMREMAAVDQYALEGGQYDVTDADRAEVEQRLAALSSAIDPTTLANAQVLDRKAQNAPRSEATTEEAKDTWLGDSEQVLILSPVRAMQLVEHGAQDQSLSAELQAMLQKVLAVMRKTPQALQSAVLSALPINEAATVVQLLADRVSQINLNHWGDRGTPDIFPDEDIVRAFEQNGDLTAEQVIRGLASKFAGDSMERRLLEQGKRTVNPQLRVRYITTTTPADMPLDKPASGARGWYVNTGTAEEIYVLSPDFKHSALTPEVLLHELIHASVAAVIEHPSADAAPLVQELGDILDAARTYVADNALTGYGEALGSVQELVAWGMSNPAFQRNVLAKVQFESKTRSNKLVTALQKFVATLTKLFFGKTSKSVDPDAMSALISNVSGLFEQAAQGKPAFTANLAQQGPIGNAQALPTHQLAEALNAGNLGSAFLSHLDGLLGGIVDALHGPNGSFKALLEANVGLSPIDMFQKAQDDGVAPFASAVLAAPFKTPERAAFVIEQVEATMRAALQGNDRDTTALYTALARLYKEVARQVTVQDFHDGDWATADATQRALAQEQYDFVFAVEAGADNRSDYLARFAALGLAHPQIHALLQKTHGPKTRDIADGKTFTERLQILFDKILAIFNRTLIHTFDGERADKQLTTLVTQLVGIEAKKRRTVAKAAFAGIDTLETGIKNLAEGARNKIADLAGSEFLRKNKNAFVRAGSGVAVIWARDKVDQMMTELDTMRNKHVEGQHGMLAGLLTEFRGHSAAMQVLARMTKNNERQREFIIKQVGRATLESFANQGRDLQDEDKAAITMLLRTDLSTLLDTHSMEDLGQLLTQRTTLSNEIRAIENQLAQFKHFQHYYVKGAKLLAYYKATGAVRGAHVLMNAGNIARLYGTPFAGRVTPAQASQAEALIDRLVSLRALQYTDTKVKARAAAVLDAERARADQRNGVEFVLHQHRALQQQSKERLFQDAEALQMKGYTSEIFNPNIEFVAADAVEGETLEAMGYSKHGMLQQDAADPDQTPKFLYVTQDGGLTRRLSGAISLKGMHAKGTRKHSGFTQAWSEEGVANAGLQAQIDAKKQAAIRQMFDPDPGFDPSKLTENHLAPVLNADGEVVNYRYLMLDSTKDLILERDNRFDKILGTMAGSIFDKESTPVQNRKVVQELKAMYDAEFATKPEAFLHVSHNSTDPELRELYRLLPKKTKDDIRAIWGRDGMRVRADVLTIGFGYRKGSVGDVFERVDQDRQSGTRREGFQARGEELLVDFVEGALRHYAGAVLNPLRRAKGEKTYDVDKYARKAAMVMRRNERIWQEIVAETKDIIVTKTGTVLLFNILSNVSLLGMHGVPLTTMLRNSWIGMKGAIAYQKATRQRFQLQNRLDTGMLTGQTEAQIRREIAILDDDIARNPVRELIEAGLMPTIVEDIEADDDIYSYKSRLVKKTDRLTAKLHPGIVSAGRTLYMAHDTKLYRGLSHVTQLSDFVGRYTLYQHLTTKKDPMGKTEAIQEASDSFVNYDIPMPKGMQYLDDMGVTMFTKYFLRIQRVLLKLMRDHPARVMGFMLMNHYLELMPLVTDSSALAKFGNNPLHLGAMQFPSTLDELATVNAGLSLFK